MADRPIIFSAPMVRALLDARKTQTRRALKPQPFMTNDGWWAVDRCGALGRWYPTLHGLHPHTPGDRLWVREAWAPLDACTHGDPGTAALAAGCFYRADYPVDCGDVSRWRPSTHMPRWASRLTLTVTDVRVQRLQEISEEDARAEGAAWHDGRGIGHSGWRHDLSDVHANARSSFARLWNSIHGDGAWDANPWVAAITFTVEQRNIDAEAPHG